MCFLMKLPWRGPAALIQVPGEYSREVITGSWSSDPVLSVGRNLSAAGLTADTEPTRWPAGRVLHARTLTHWERPPQVTHVASLRGMRLSTKILVSFLLFSVIVSSLVVRCGCAVLCRRLSGRCAWLCDSPETQGELCLCFTDYSYMFMFLHDPMMCAMNMLHLLLLFII